MVIPDFQQRPICPVCLGLCLLFGLPLGFPWGLVACWRGLLFKSTTHRGDPCGGPRLPQSQQVFFCRSIAAQAENHLLPRVYDVGLFRAGICALAHWRTRECRRPAQILLVTAFPPLTWGLTNLGALVVEGGTRWH